MRIPTSDCHLLGETSLRWAARSQEKAVEQVKKKATDKHENKCQNHDLCTDGVAQRSVTS